MSGGMLWVPNNRAMLAAGLSDSREDALTYMRRLTLGRVSDELIQTYGDECNHTIDFLESRTKPFRSSASSYRTAASRYSCSPNEARLVREI